ncbi:MAG: type II toxin-antitoxin system RelE/ParE family toxin [Desulfuromonadales bacterium]|nr:type II toxin-antitoxin system RelE/ParE family toxin [Desulfuromonadales bacterium]
MIPVRYHPAALEEIIQGAEYYEAKVDRLGQRFLDEVERCVSEIAAAPERWPTFLLNTRRRLLDRFPYTLVYFRTGDQVYILAAMHQKRRPGYWRKRLNLPAR